MSWPFADPPNVITYATVDVIDRGLPIVFVTHNEEDGAWQFHSANGAPADLSEARWILLKNILARDPSVAELADLPLGWYARRDGAGGAWRRGRETSRPDP